MLTSRRTPTRAVAALAAIGSLAAAAAPASAAPAKPIKTTPRSAPQADYCALGTQKTMSQLSDKEANHAVQCLVNKARKDNGVPALVYAPDKTFMGRSATQHAQKSAAQRWWTTWESSHMEPGAPGDYNTQVTQRIRATGYCPTGSWQTREVTYTQPDNAHPADAVNWWMSDPPHREVLLDPTLKVSGPGVAHGYAQTDKPSGAGAGTFVVDFGSCNGGYLSV